MTWEIAVGIFALVAFVIGILTYKNNGQKEREETLKTLTKLNTTVDTLNTTLSRLQANADKTHGELYAEINNIKIELAKIKAES